MSDPYDRLVYEVVEIVRQTSAGVLLRLRDGNDEITEEWFPKSQVDYDAHEVSLPRWLALDKGLGRAVRAYTQRDALYADEPTPEIKPERWRN